MDQEEEPENNAALKNRTSSIQEKEQQNKEHCRKIRPQQQQNEDHEPNTSEKQLGERKEQKEKTMEKPIRNATPTADEKKSMGRAI